MSEQSITTAERQLCETCGSPDHPTGHHEGSVAQGHHEGSVAGEKIAQGHHEGSIAEGHHEGSVAGERPEENGEKIADVAQGHHEGSIA